jgi:hypothetical protein
MLGHSPVAGLPISGVPDVAAGSPPAAPDLPPGKGVFPHTVPRREFGYSQVFANLLLTTLAVSGTTLRPPVVTPRAAVQAPQVTQAPNLLVTTLTPAVAAAPFAQKDWPNPRVLRFIQPADPQNLLTSTLEPTGAVQAPFAQEDWPNPRIPSRALPFALPNLLTGTLAPAAVAAPFAQTDWSVPSPRARAQDWSAPNLLGTILAPAAAQAPFAQDDWPNPRTAPRAQDGAVQAPNLALLAPPVNTPFAQEDWPNPRASVRVQPEQAANLLPLASTPVGAPFAQSQWPNPALPRFRPELVGFTQSTRIPFVSCFSGQQLGWLRAICYLRGLIPGLPANHSTMARTAGPVTQTLTGDDVLATLTTTASFGGDPTGSHLTAEESELLEMLARSFGLVAPITTDIAGGTISDGTLNQTIVDSAGTTIVTRT